MVIDRLTRNTLDTKRIAQFNSEEIDVQGNFGRVYINFDAVNKSGVEHLYRLSLSKEEAIELVKELYTYLEPDL